MQPLRVVPSGKDRIRLLALAALGLLIGLYGCATDGWQPAPGRIVSAGWSIQAPPGWMRLSTPSYEMLSKDGPYLQYMYLQERPLGGNFLHTQRRLEPGMLPHEVAQIIIDNLRSDPQISSFALLENSPATVAGQPGFKLVFTYTDNQGVGMQSVYYGTISADRFFNLRYTAARRHFFAADLKTFEAVFRSLRLSPVPGTSG